MILYKFEFINKQLLLPIMMKSCSSVILNDFISGSQIITLGFPLNFSSLASISPKVLETLIIIIKFKFNILINTDSLPGNTLRGPSINYVYIF